MAKTLIIRELSRCPEHGSEDRLHLEPGVNLIVGAPNTGKTQWMKMLDFLLGDDSKPEELFGELNDKYDSAQMKIEISSEKFIVERRWKEPGFKTKVLIDGEGVTLREYREWLMGKLDIPIVHYPKGNPYGPSTWPELGWRQLCRHIYRRQSSWGDIADQQYPVDQHACILLFLGLAERLFTVEYGDLVTKEKKVLALQFEKDQFIAMLQDVSREIMDEKELGVALTPQSIEAAETRIADEITNLQSKRKLTLDALLTAAVPVQKAADGPTQTKNAVERMGDDLARLHSEQQAAEVGFGKASDRMTEMKGYRVLIAEELSRMQRAKQAGSMLADIKVTHCPACDREIAPAKEGSDYCNVCGRKNVADGSPDGVSYKRLEFEIDQLEGELGETDELIAVLARDTQKLAAAKVKIDEQIERISFLLKPIRVAAAAIIPPDLSLFDMETGRLQERLQQLRRIKSSLEHRQELAERINVIQKEVAKLQAEVAEQKGEIDFESARQLLADCMNTYLHFIHIIDENSWNHGEVSLRLSESDFKFMVGKGRWRDKLGGTLTLYFLIAYHYALLSLVKVPDTHYPGLVLLDLPGKLEDARFVEDKENFVVEPFIELTGAKGMEETQFIAAGSAFENLAGANRIKLTHVWGEKA